MRGWLTIGAVNGFLGVAAGAFGAHALGTRHLSGAMPTLFERAGTYHLVHALALIGAALTGTVPGVNPRWAQAACVLFLLGIVLFCGSLYLLGATGSRALVLVTPIGGMAFLLGWVVWAAAAWPRSGSGP